MSQLIEQRRDLLDATYPDYPPVPGGLPRDDLKMEGEMQVGIGTPVPPLSTWLEKGDMTRPLGSQDSGNPRG